MARIKPILYNPDEWMNALRQNLGSNYQIGLHQVGVFNKNKSELAVKKNNILARIRRVSSKDICNNIMQTGLLNSNDDISKTVSPFGTIDEIEKDRQLKEMFLNYEYSSDLSEPKNGVYDIVVAIPESVKIDGEEYYFGHFKHPFVSSTNDQNLSVCKRIFGSDDIPPEFIYGYIRKRGDQIEFVPNPKFIGCNLEFIRSDFYKKIIAGRKLSSITEENQRVQYDNLSNSPFCSYQKYLIRGLYEKITELKTQENYDYNELQRLNKDVARILSAKDFKELGIEDIDSVIETLMSNNINPTFESYEQAFDMAPIACGSNVLFMMEAVSSDPSFISFDKTNNEELYKLFLDKIILEVEQKLKSNISEYDKLCFEERLGEIKAYKKELENPKKVEPGKYKVPHRFMFEELKSIRDIDKYLSLLYLSVDGVYDETFGKELEALHDDPGIILGVHGFNGDYSEKEANIFKQGLCNSKQGHTTLNRTVAFEKDLPFVRALNYRFLDNGNEADVVIIVTLPIETFDYDNPMPIWGCNSSSISDTNNYILPKYVYGVYHSKEDGPNRKIIKNYVPESERILYPFLKCDMNSSCANRVVENSEFQFKDKTL